MIKNRTACLVAMTVMVGFFTACSESKTSGPETVAPTDSAAPTTDLPTTPAPTTVAPTLAPTTTVPPAAFLREDGLGAFNFGATYVDVLAGMPLTVRSDEGSSFPVVRDTYYFNADESVHFGYPSARRVCWDDGVGNSLCAHFGGADPSTLQLVGWVYIPAGGGVGPRGVVGPLFAASGATVNILMSDVPAIPPVQGECSGFTNIFLDGILLSLQAPSNEEFGTYADDGSYTLNVPPPAGYINNLEAGERPIDFDGADC